jgi:hypothetical protein
MKLFKDGLEIPDPLVKAMEHDLVDIEQWIREAAFGKANNCYKRMRDQWLEKLLTDPTVRNIAATTDGFIDQVTKHPDYKNRVERERDAELTA